MKTHTIFQLCFTLALCFLGSQSVFAQTPSTTAPSTDTTKYLIVKNDGNEYVGQILSDDGREVLIETKSLGKIYIPKSDIKSMRPINYNEDISKGEVSTAGVFTTRSLAKAVRPFSALVNTTSDTPSSSQLEMISSSSWP